MNGDNDSYLDAPNSEAIEPSGELFDGVLEGHKYSPDTDGQTYSLTYSFPGPGSRYDQESYSPFDHNWPNEGLTRLSVMDIEHFEDTLNFLERITNLEFIKVEDGGISAGTIRPAWFEGNSVTFSGYAEAPFPARTSAGDIWFSQKNLTNGLHPEYPRIAIHELGHALGLKHPHEIRPGGFPLLDDNWLGREYTIMAYKVSVFHTEMTQTDLHPQTFMYLDIMALQYMYGADMVTTAGNDSYSFSQQDQHYLTIWDAGGNDTIEVTDGTRPVSIDLRPGTWSNVGSLISYNNGTPLLQSSENRTLFITPDVTIENATGAGGRDTLQGNSVSNKLKGNEGNDRLYGEAGNDLLVGGAGNDSLWGGEGNDGLWAGSGDAGNDRLVGGSGNDGLGGGKGNDLLIGGDSNADGADTLSGGEGDDTLVGGGWTNSENSFGQFLVEDAMLSGTEADRLWAGAGDDLILAASGSDTIGAGSGNDDIRAGGGNDHIFASSGNDTINGGAGTDLIYAGDGDDLIEAKEGSDTIWGGSGDDTLTGGGDADTFSYTANSGHDLILDFDAATDTLLLTNTATTFNSRQDILAVSEQAPTGLLINLGGEASVLLEDLTLADVDTINFQFG